MEKFSIWKDTLWPGDDGGSQYNITQRSPKLISYLKPQMPIQSVPLTMVLHGPAGVGKTTLAKQLMLDWTQDNLAKTPNSAFYLSCKDLNHKDTCTFAELISENGPDLQDVIPRILAQAQKILFIIDGFDELRVPLGALIHDTCGDWQKQKPVPVLLGSLLKRKMLPKSSLVITTRPGALRELRLLVEQPLFIEIEGFLELDRRAYFLKHFEEESQALRAFDLMKNNAALFHMGSAPAVCWIICTCLKRQMEKGEDPASTCQTTTSLFLRFLCSQFTPAHSSCPGVCLQAPVKSVCLLAAEGIWTQTSVFDGEDLERLGVKESALCPFLDKNILQKSTDCEGCYSFIHLSVQQFLAAMFYVLETKEEEEEEDVGGHRWHIGDVQKLLSKEERLKNPNLTQVGYFLFGLSKEERALELETTFGCLVSMEVKQELLKCRSMPNGKKPFSMTDMKEILYCLYESQEEELVEGAMAPVKEISIHLTNIFEMMQSSFCLKHCRNLQKLSLQVGKRIFLENDTTLKSDAQVERSQHDHHSLHVWTDLCTVFSSNKNLTFLDVRESFLSHSSVRILCEQITHVTCHLQKVVIQNVSPADAYRDFCLAFIGKKTLTHLVLEGSVHSDKMLLLLLCEILKHPRCNLQYLRLGSRPDTSQRRADFSSALKVKQSLKCLGLTASEFLDEGVKLLCSTLRHPTCFLQKLSLENCHLTEACCKELSSALIVNQRLTNLCLAKNNLGVGGVKILCEGLSYPECQLQTLVLCHCNINRHGCKYISKLLQGDSSLTNLDLGFNPIATGLCFLSEALKKPNCNLKCLGLWGCSICPLSCQDLASALVSNQSLETLDLGQNILGQSGIMVLLEALKQNNSPLKTLRLKIDKSTMEVQKLLKDVRESNPKLTIECNTARTNRSSCCDFLS
ncbi:NACHT, LRR and PYD domains-containing protein 7 [Hippopotamus amphibius kiboko]|uniref:NACHT, LRR and PYD domains-containing protein 7 n=1 Tax=Hippopotamus amphibius kiboko TaxID=575201 RepID=UPI002597BD2A|nr:NACHT, LRR and PYD domains-containing protein 7 [Hippopotamus amphibius kiboko]